MSTIRSHMLKQTCSWILGTKGLINAIHQSMKQNCKEKRGSFWAGGSGGEE